MVFAGSRILYVIRLKLNLVCDKLYLFSLCNEALKINDYYNHNIKMLACLPFSHAALYLISWHPQTPARPLAALPKS